MTGDDVQRGDVMVCPLDRGGGVALITDVTGRGFVLAVDGKKFVTEGRVAHLVWLAGKATRTWWPCENPVWEGNLVIRGRGSLP